MSVRCILNTTLTERHARPITLTLYSYVQEAGSVVRADVAAGPDGRSKGFGTVAFASADDAARAIQVFNGSDYAGRQLVVRPDAKV